MLKKNLLIMQLNFLSQISLQFHSSIAYANEFLLQWDELPLINVQAALIYPGSLDPALPGSGNG